jgi:hypothetical protein
VVFRPSFIRWLLRAAIRYEVADFPLDFGALKSVHAGVARDVPCPRCNAIASDAAPRAFLLLVGAFGRGGTPPSQHRWRTYVEDQQTTESNIVASTQSAAEAKPQIPGERGSAKSRICSSSAKHGCTCG